MSTLDRSAEVERLEAVAADSWYGDGANAAMIRYCAGVFRRHWAGRCRALELGPAEGLLTDVLAEDFEDLTVVDGSALFVEALRERLPGARVVHSLFEDFSPEPGEQFDTIVLGHVLEHVDDPVGLLQRAAGWLSPDGVLLTAVPNAQSVHRQAAVIMGLLDREDDLNDTDRHHGHRRVYTPALLESHVAEAGLEVAVSGGYWLKPVSNGQIEATWTTEMLDAFMELGERFPDIAAEIYIVARRPDAVLA